MRSVWLTLVLGAAGAVIPMAAQEFHPPPVQRPEDRGTRIGLFGFGVRSGFDLTGRTQLVLGAALDAGNLFTPRFRIRPSVDIGVFHRTNTYVGSFEALYRFADEAQAAVPYAGLGFSVAGHDACSADPDCPDLWANVVLGFELHYRSTFNWVVEYHGMEGFRRTRLYLGLTTRRGS